MIKGLCNECSTILNNATTAFVDLMKDAQELNQKQIDIKKVSSVALRATGAVGFAFAGLVALPGSLFGFVCGAVIGVVSYDLFKMGVNLKNENIVFRIATEFRLSNRLPVNNTHLAEGTILKSFWRDCISELDKEINKRTA